MTRYVTSILEFVAQLRKQGFSIGLAEAMAAMEALEFVELSDRDAMRYALSACLSKSEREQERFHAAFSRYFVGEAQRAERHVHETKAAQEREELLRASAQELAFQNEPLDLSERQLEIYASLEPDEKEKLQQFLDKTSTGLNVTPKLRFVTEQMVKSKLNRAGRTRQGSDGAGEGGSGGETDLLKKSINAITDDELPQVRRLIGVLVRRLNGSISRKARRAGKKAAIDLKQTIHRSLNTGGTLFVIVRKRKRRRKQQLLLLCDVSASMVRFSGFALSFLFGMNLAADRSKSYLFSESVEEVVHSELRTMEAFEQHVLASALWNKGTNLAKALAFLLDEQGAMGGTSVAMIVSDAKTLETQKTCELLEELSRRVKRIIWLNPVPQEEWELMPWIACFCNWCTMLDCSTVEKLAEACARADDILF